LLLVRKKEKEKQVVKLAVEGKTTCEISEMAYISLKDMTGSKIVIRPLMIKMVQVKRFCCQWKNRNWNLYTGRLSRYL
jgi:hypothetical protein